MSETIRIETDSRGVATLSLARPNKHNALSQAMMEDLTRAAAGLGADPAVRVVVLAGDGASFCAGGERCRCSSTSGTSRCTPAP